ncbi:MAG: hypothetical protein Q9202_007354 [Teloschistes flavicans]
MEAVESHQALDTRVFSLAYEKCLRQNDVLHGIESLRKLRVHVLLCENENEHLREQINEDEQHMQRMEHGKNAMRTRIKKLEASLESAHGEARVKSREIETLKAETHSLHSVTMDSTKLLTEKLALARELSTLRPEIDHFRSQVASNRTLLAEKLLLEHRLSTVQMELESEKKSMQHVLAKDGKMRAEDAKIESQLQLIKAELQREQRARQTLERENREASSTWDAQKITLESRLETFRSKLRTTKDSLKDAQRELQDARSTAKSDANERADAQHGRNTMVNTKKRNAAQMLSDSMIGTPGGMVNDRRTKRASTLPGDKSTFSITPYLSRMASAAPESLPEEATQSCGIPDIDDRATVLVQENKKKGTAKAKVVPGQKKSKTGVVLEQVAEEKDGEDDMVEQNPPRQNEPPAGDDTTLGGNELGKRKKRRLFGGEPGKTLFDEDEPEVNAPGVRAHYHETPIGLDRQYRTDDNHGMTARSYLELEKQSRILAPGIAHDSQGCQEEGEKGRSGRESYIVDVVLSDMSAPWEQTEGFWKRSLSDPYYRMMNTSGINFRDHAGSMDLCEAALKFASDTLRPGGHFVCKFYQGSEDRALEERLKTLFSKVHREKPESSRSVRIPPAICLQGRLANLSKTSKESFFIAMKRKGGVSNAEMQG